MQTWNAVWQPCRDFVVKSNKTSWFNYNLNFEITQSSKVRKGFARNPKKKYIRRLVEIYTKNFFRGRKCSFNNRGDYLWQTSNKISLKVRRNNLGLLTGLPKNLFQISTFSWPCSERKDKNENYLKDTIPETFSPGLVIISFDIPADFFFQKSEKFCSLF